MLAHTYTQKLQQQQQQVTTHVSAIPTLGLCRWFRKLDHPEGRTEDEHLGVCGRRHYCLLHLDQQFAHTLEAVLLFNEVSAMASML